MVVSRRIVLWALVAMAFAVDGARGDDGTVLRHKFSKGVDTIYRNSVVMTQSQSLGTMKMETEMKQEQISRQSVDEVDSRGQAKLRFKIEQLKMKVQAKPFIEYEFDSKKDEQDTSSQVGSSVTPIMQRLVGSESIVEVGGRGKLTSAQGQFDQIKDLLEANPLAKQFLGALTDEKAAAASLQDQFVQFPEKGLKKGDSWTIDEEVDLGVGKIKTTRKYTFESPDRVGDRKTLRIAYSVTGNVEVNTDQGGQKVSGALTIGNSQGTLHFDPVAGQVVKQEETVEFTGRLLVVVNGMSISVDTAQKQRLTRELLNKLP